MILTPFISWYSFIEELNIDNMIKIKHESRVFYFFKLIIYLFYLTRKTRVGQCQWSKRLLAKHDSNYKERERERENVTNQPKHCKSNDLHLLYVFANVKAIMKPSCVVADYNEFQLKTLVLLQHKDHSRNILVALVCFQ